MNTQFQMSTFFLSTQNLIEMIIYLSSDILLCFIFQYHIALYFSKHVL